MGRPSPEVAGFLGLCLATVALWGVLAAAQWPGVPDRCLNQACWCEPLRGPPVQEFFNTVSNLPIFVLAVLMAQRAADSRQRGRLRSGAVQLAFAYALWTEATGAFFYHAALVRWSAVLDGGSVLCIWGVLFSTSLFRIFGWNRRQFLLCLASTQALAGLFRGLLFEAIEWPGLVYLGLTLAAEAFLVQTGPRPRRLTRLRVALLCLAGSALTWSLSLPGSPACEADFPGHAVWHLLAAMAVFFFGLHGSEDAERRAPAGLDPPRT